MTILTVLLCGSLLVGTDCKTSTIQKDPMRKEIKPEAKMNNVFFNHAYAIIDEKTYDSIKSSAFLKNEFCHCDERTNQQ